MKDTKIANLRLQALERAEKTHSKTIYYHLNRWRSASVIIIVIRAGPKRRNETFVFISDSETSTLLLGRCWVWAETNCKLWAPERSDSPEARRVDNREINEPRWGPAKSWIIVLFRRHWIQAQHDSWRQTTPFLPSCYKSYRMKAVDVNPHRRLRRSCNSVSRVRKREREREGGRERELNSPASEFVSLALLVAN